MENNENILCDEAKFALAKYISNSCYNEEDTIADNQSIKKIENLIIHTI
jgi:hypothetical protein